MENLTSEKNLLEDFYERPLEFATVGQRFLNYIIDMASFYLLIFSGALLAGIILRDSEFLEDMGDINPVLDRIVTHIAFAVYIALLEGLTKGKTLGKLLTKTRAVYENGTKITFRTGFLRGLSRIVPFEQFSAFSGHPWHDSWTDTRVVKEESLNPNFNSQNY